jgi:hypothetical protein
MWRAGALVVLIAAAASAGSVYHGDLFVKPAAGTIDPMTGNATLKLRNWDLVPAFNSQGIWPDRESIVIAIGDSGTNEFRIPAGQVRATHRGRLYVYRARGSKVRGIATLQMKRLGDRFHVSMSLRGVDLSRVANVSSDCLSMAIVIGEDDGFTGIQLLRPGLDLLRSHRVRVVGHCTPVSSWPWLS